jgi:hypothetical protein
VSMITGAALISYQAKQGQLITFCSNTWKFFKNLKFGGRDAHQKSLGREYTLSRGIAVNTKSRIRKHITSGGGPGGESYEV